MHNFRLLQHEHDKVTCSDHDGCHSECPCYISEYIFLISHQDLDMPCLIYHFLNKIISKKGITNCFSIELRNLVYWIFKNRAGIDCPLSGLLYSSRYVTPSVLAIHAPPSTTVKGVRSTAWCLITASILSLGVIVSMDSSSHNCFVLHNILGLLCVSCLYYTIVSIRSIVL